jgi:hypothetical protein
MKTEITNALQIIANQINKEIAEYNERNDILHPLIWAGVNEDEEHVFFEITHFRTHSASEESALYNAINNIGRTLSAAGFADTLQSSSDNSFTASFSIIQ